MFKINAQMSRDSSVGLATDYWLEARMFSVRVLGRKDFSPFQVAQTDSGAHPASYPMGGRGSFLGIILPGPETTTHQLMRSRIRGSILHSLLRLHDVVLN
jgi:hypothetical protein